MLRVESVHFAYGPVRALKDVSLTVGKAEIVALLGANGAGKTTLLNCISGLIRPQSGEIKLDGALISGRKAHRVVEAGVVQVPEGRQLFAAPRMPYTKMLLGAVPDLAMSGRQRIPVKGEIPNPIDPPPGCAFNPRCPLAFDLCRREAPQLIDGVACHAVNTAPAPA
jgi:oligopeptide/dipeptide ABC transporter ATP-binding protein